MGELYRLDFASGKSYIGATVGTALQRFRRHHKASDASTKGAVYMAWRKYGVPRLTVLAVVQPVDLDETETRAIAVFCTLDPRGYNISPGGKKPVPFLPTVAAKISESLRGRRLSDVHRERIKLALKRRVVTPESRERMSKAQKGRTFSVEARKRMAAAKLGTRLPASARAKMSVSQQARRRSEKGMR